MPYRYSKIYNATQGVWAHNVAGEDDPQQICEDNEWNENDALVGFYSDGESDFHNVIFCRPGYAVYVQAEEDKDRTEFNFDDNTYRIPPAILVNLNNAYDTKFMYSKAYSEEMDTESDDDDEYESDDDDDESDEVDGLIISRKYPKLFTCCPENESIIPLLQKCRSNTDNYHKKRAYTRAIIEVLSIDYKLDAKSVNNLEVGESIKRKITEYIMGIAEDDIINS